MSDLFTQEDLDKLQSQSGVDSADNKAWVKIFNPYGVGTWYLIDYDGDDTFFGYCDLGYPEYGSVAKSELESIDILEKDEHYEPMLSGEIPAYHRKVTGS